MYVFGFTRQMVNAEAESDRVFFISIACPSVGRDLKGVENETLTHSRIRTQRLWYPLIRARVVPIYTSHACIYSAAIYSLLTF